MFLGAILLSVVVLVFSSSMVSESWSSMSFLFCIVRVSLKSFAFPIVLPYVMISFLSNRPIFCRVSLFLCENCNDVCYGEVEFSFYEE